MDPDWYRGQLFTAVVYSRKQAPGVSDRDLQDFEDYAAAEMFGVQPWEAGDLPVYWIERKPILAKLLEEVRDHYAAAAQKSAPNAAAAP